jgi:hypothetical protein
MANVGVVIPSPLPTGMALPEIARLAYLGGHAEMDRRRRFLMRRNQTRRGLLRYSPGW